MQQLLFEHGANDWNHLPVAEVTAHLSSIRDGSVRGFVAEVTGELVGVMTYETGNFYPEYEPAADTRHGYIAEGVVDRRWVGKRVGLLLMQSVLEAFTQEGIVHIYAKRHEENPFSSRLLQKAGFTEVSTFYDPEVRPTGSRRTTVCRYVVRS